MNSGVADLANIKTAQVCCSYDITYVELEPTYPAIGLKATKIGSSEKVAMR